MNKLFVSEDELQQKLKRPDELNVLLSLDHGISNFYVHSCGAIDVSLVWDMLTEDIPQLKAVCVLCE